MTWLLANTMVAASLGLIVLAISRWGRPAPAVMHGLWLVVVLKLVTPPLFEVPVDFGWLPSNSRMPEHQVPLASSPAVASAETSQLPARALALSASDVVTVETLPVTIETPTVAASDSIWLWSWLGSATLLLLGIAWQTLRVHRRHRRFGSVPPMLRLEVSGLADRIGVAMPELCDDPQSAAPYVWAIGRTRLILPVRLLMACSRQGRAAVIAHELAHLHRRDHWIARCELVLLTLLWWHPLFWFARSRMRLWAELACDAIALHIVPGANLDYATLLVDAAARPITSPPRTWPGMAVLASRPAARAAFERRLKMILNENLPRRASCAWCVPFAGLALGLFALPVSAQKQEQEPEAVRVEIRVNGKPVTGLSAAQRRALLEVLLDERKPPDDSRSDGKRPPLEIAPDPEAPDARDAKPEPRRPARNRNVEGLPQAGQLAEALQQGLAEARSEIRSDPDLAELGITDEVLRLVDVVANGEGIESSLDDVVRAAMKGAGRMAIREIENDPDLRRLGLHEGIGKLVTGLLQNEDNQQLVGQLARTALDSALGEARREIRKDKDLRKLGIDGDVERLLDSVLTGNGDFAVDLERIIKKAMQAAMNEVEGELGTEDATQGKPARRQVNRRRERETIR